MPVFDDEDDGRRRPTEELRRIARYQRWLIATLLAQVGLWVGFVALTALGVGPAGDGLRLPLFLAFLIGCVGGIFAFLLGWTVRGPVSAVAMGVGVVVPCLGLVVLTVVNGMATTALRANGVRVGMFGADPDAIAGDEPYGTAEDDDAGW
jgi:hypothetical protein